jgi:hypothetical protein
VWGRRAIIKYKRWKELKLITSETVGTVVMGRGRGGRGRRRHEDSRSCSCKLFGHGFAEWQESQYSAILPIERLLLYEIPPVIPPSPSKSMDQISIRSVEDPERFSPYPDPAFQVIPNPGPDPSLKLGQLSH